MTQNSSHPSKASNTSVRDRFQRSPSRGVTIDEASGQVVNDDGTARLGRRDESATHCAVTDGIGESPRLEDRVQ